MWRWIIDCPGDEERANPDGPSQEMIELRFKYSHYVSKTGGDIYRFQKQKTQGIIGES